MEERPEAQSLKLKAPLIARKRGRKNGCDYADVVALDNHTQKLNAK